MKITIATVDRYLELQEMRRKLNREADSLEREEKMLRSAMFEATQAAGGTLTKGKHRLAIVEKNGTVSWKDAFIRVAGAEEALRLQEDAPKREALEVS